MKNTVLAVALMLVPSIALGQPAWLNDDLRAYYPFDVNVQDMSGNGYHFQQNGEPFQVEGKVGNAIAFDGIDDSLFTTPLITAFPYTFSCWLKFDVDTTEINVFSCWGGSVRWSPAPNILPVEDKWFINAGHYASGNVSFNSEPFDRTSDWFHFALTADVDGTLASYINGEQVGVLTDQAYGQLNLNEFQLGTKG